jgi:TM2 domain-containing membrane protein YozV
VRSVGAPLNLSAVLLVCASGLGQLLSSYGLWGFATTRPFGSWFPLTVVIFAAVLIALHALWTLYNAVCPAFKGPLGWQFTVVGISLVLLPLQEFILALIAQSDNNSPVFDLDSAALSSMTVIVRVCSPRTSLR